MAPKRKSSQTTGQTKRKAQKAGNKSVQPPETNTGDDVHLGLAAGVDETNSDRADSAVQAPEAALSCLDTGNVICPVPPISAKIGEHIYVSVKNKIISGAYVDLSTLMPNNEVRLNSNASFLSVASTGQLVLQQKSKQILSMESWTDLFLIYASIYLSAHPDLTQSLLKYMHIIRTGHKRFGGNGWQMYDEQFRYRMSVDPGRSWDTIDNELWLLYMQVSHTNVYSQQNALKQLGRCYDFNFKGMCYKNACSFLHKCLRCCGDHPQCSCPVRPKSAQPLTNSTEMKPSASQGYRGAVNSNFRPRSSVTRFMGPRPFPNKY